MSGTYGIPIAGLKAGRHTFDYEIGDEFFEQFEGSEVREGNLAAVVEADKRTTHVDLSVRITGAVRLCCDRCLEMFSYPIDCTNRILVKFGKNADVDDPDIIMLPADQPELDLLQHLYEFILLSVPIKRVHPEDAEGNSSCDPQMLKKLNEHLIDHDAETDPRWDDLKKLMNDN